MTDYTDFYKALKTRPESEWVSILAVALKNCTKDPAVAVENAIGKIDDMNIAEQAMSEAAMANIPRIGVDEVVL